MKFLINFFCRPVDSLAVLCHLKTGCSNAACVSCFCRSEENASCLECCDCFRSRRHVSTFAYALYAVCDKSFCAFLADLVLSSAWKSDVAFNCPDSGASFCISCVRMSLSIFFDAGSANFFDIFDRCKIDSVRIIDVSSGVAHCNNFTAELSSFLACIDCYVTGTGNNNCLSFEGSSVCFQNFVSVVAKSIAGSLCTDKGSACADFLSCQNACELICKTFVLSKEVTNFTSTNTDITSRYVCISANVTEKLCHKALAECHNFTVRFALRIEVGTTFTAAHRKGSKAVLEDLLESEELQYGKVYTRMEAKTALVRSDCGVELYAVTSVNLYFAVVINPRYAEHNNALRLNKTLDNCVLFIFRMFLNDGLERL